MRAILDSRRGLIDLRHPGCRVARAKGGQWTDPDTGRAVAGIPSGADGVVEGELRVISDGWCPISPTLAAGCWDAELADDQVEAAATAQDQGKPRYLDHDGTVVAEEPVELEPVEADRVIRPCWCDSFTGSMAAWRAEAKAHGLDISGLNDPILKADLIAAIRDLAGC